MACRSASAASRTIRAEALRQSKAGHGRCAQTGPSRCVMMGLDQAACCRHRACGPHWPPPCSAMVKALPGRAARVRRDGTRPAFHSQCSRGWGSVEVRLTEPKTNADLDTLEQWLQSSSVTPSPLIGLARVKTGSVG